ncbi:Acireductone dioxygenase ARD family, partial [Dimargaris cristalligena]
MRAYMYNDQATSEAHEKVPNEPVDLEALARLGVLYWACDGPDGREKMEQIARDRAYKNRDEVVISPDRLPNYEETLKIFFTEHIHEDEEIRFMLDGSGYFDVRDQNDRWIRLQVTAGDLIVLPAGIYHRFTLDNSNYIQVIRLFRDLPKWEAINR